MVATILTMADAALAAAGTELDRIVQVIVDAVHPLQVILFGSAARGEADPDSDLDLLVVMPDGTRRSGVAGDLHQALYESVPERRHAVDIVVATPAVLEYNRGADWTVYDTAIREGVSLYRRGAPVNG